MSSRLLRLAVSCNFFDLVINLELFGSTVRNMFGKLSGKIRRNITVHMFAKYKFNFSLFVKLVNYCCYFLIFWEIKSFYNFINFVTTSIGVEGGGAEGLEPPPPEISQGGLSPCKNLLNFMAVTILANPETLDVAKKGNIHT